MRSCKPLIGITCDWRAEAEGVQGRLLYLDAHQAGTNQRLCAGHDLDGQVVVLHIGELGVLNQWGEHC